MWSRRHSSGRQDLEEALRGHRVDASAEFVEDLSDRIGAQRLAGPRVWSRLAFASAVTVFILGTFASFGGLSYAASGAAATFDTAKQVVVKHKLVVTVHTSSAAGQYPHKPAKPKPSTFKPPKAPNVVVAAAVAAPSGQSLPFTGLSLLATFLSSLALIGAGVALRRRERRS